MSQVFGLFSSSLDGFGVCGAVFSYKSLASGRGDF